MIDLIQQLKKKFITRGNGAPGPHPQRDWFIILGTTLILIVLSIVWNVWFFNRVANTDFFIEAEEANALTTYPAGAIQELFRTRAEIEAAYRSSFPFVDPSR